jgi:hypothetical protein
MAPYPRPACGIAAAWDGDDYIYAAGGNPTPATSAFKYSISLNMWTPIAIMPGDMNYCGGAFAGGKFHVIGGISGPTTHYAYNPVTDTWSTAAAVPTAIHFATFSVGNDPDMTKMYSIGGGGGYGSWPATNAVQIYDPPTDTWTQETVLPVAYGTNAADYCYDGIGMSAGGYDGATNHAETYMGTGFPGGGYDIDIELTYQSGSPVPEEGGDIDFNVYIENNDDVAVDFDGWLDIEFAGSPPTTVVERPFFDYQPGWTTDRDVYFPVPGTWSAGLYELWGRVGYWSNTIWDESGFPFEKEGTYDGAFIPWVPDGVPNPFDTIDKGEAGLVVSEFTLMSNHPNPFNPSTSINFTLTDAGIVRLAVYDIAGREVVELVNGYRQAGNHEATFNASGLASGVYIYELTSGNQTAISKMILMK